MDRRLMIGLLVLSFLGCNRPSIESAPTSDTSPTAASSETKNKYIEPFNTAVTSEIGPGQLPPVEQTIAGKSTAELRIEVERLWPTIKLVDEEDKPLPWVVTLETDAGTIEIALRPELAPNHVRNFIALVKAGYFDGLRFDRLVHQEATSPDGTKSVIRLVRFGCPAGTGDPGVGHLGYRLRSEFSDEKHAAGTVGFTRDEDPSSAGTRLYISLAPAPVRDSNYTIVGSVSKGLDTVEKIASGKLLLPSVDPTREIPERPTVIKKATAEYKETTK